MSQLYVKERPAAIPLDEHERRRKEKDAQEIIQVAKKKGKTEASVRLGLQQLDTILPSSLNLHKMKASDWLSVLLDVDAVAEKVVLLKAFYPAADVSRIVALRPKLLLSSTKDIEEDALKVKALLSSAKNPDAIIQAVPDMSDPLTLSRSLAQLAAMYPKQSAVAMLEQNPAVIKNLGGESDMEDSAEYGELSTKD